MADKVLDPVDVNEIPEVSALQEVQQRIQIVRDANAEFFQQYGELVEEYNEKLDAAIKAVRARQVSCGDIIKFQEAKKYDAEACYQYRGHQDFLSVGGKVRQIAQYDLDKRLYEAAHQAGQVSDEEYERVVSITPRYHKPEKMSV